MKTPKIQFKESPPAEAYLTRYGSEDTESMAQSDEAKGNLCLNMPDAAAAVLERALASSPGDGDLESLKLLAEELSGASASELAARAVDLLSRHPQNARIVEMAILYLCLSEDYPEVLRLYDRYRDTGMLAATDLHAVACAAAQLGDYKMALNITAKAVPGHHRPGNLITDCQLLPLWQHFAGTTPDPEEAKLLVLPELQTALNQALRSNVSGSVCEYAMRRVVPAKFRPWLHRSISSHFKIASDTPGEIVRAFRLWMDELRRRNIRIVRRAIQRGNEPPVSKRPRRRVKADRGEAHTRSQVAALNKLIDASNDPEQQAELRDEIGSICMSWFIENLEAETEGNQADPRPTEPSSTSNP